VAIYFLARKSLEQAIKPKKGERMHLLYLTMLAFLFMNALSTSSTAPTKWTTVHAAFQAPTIVLLAREPFLAAEQETRAAIPYDGTRIRPADSSASAYGSNAYATTRAAQRWAPWLWGS
jgi:hypothetical protein